MVSIYDEFFTFLSLLNVFFPFKLYDLCLLFLENVMPTERADIRSRFNSVLYQLLLDPSERVCFEAILCILGKHDSAERCLLNLTFIFQFHPFFHITRL